MGPFIFTQNYTFPLLIIPINLDDDNFGNLYIIYMIERNNVVQKSGY